MDPHLRDVLLFVSGSIVIGHQVAIADHAQTILVCAGLAMMLGTPVILALIRRWTGEGGNDRRGPDE